MIHLSQRIRHSVRNRRGSVLIEFLAGFTVLMTCIAFAMTVLPIFAVKMKLNNAADRLLRQAEMSGHTNLSLLIDELQDETDLPFTVSWAGTDYLDGSGEVQLNHDIKLLVSMERSIGISGIASFPVTVTTKLSGASEVYQKIGG